MLRYRLGLDSASDPALPTPWDVSGASADSRYFFWRFGPRLYGNFNDGSGGTTNYVPLSLTEEMKLRRANGLNSPEQIGTALDDLMQAFVRDNLDGEANYREVDLTNAGASSSPPTTSIRDYFEFESRHQMTTTSRAAILTPLLTGDSGRVLQTDLNTATLQDIATAAATVYSGASAFPNPVFNNALDFADQFAVNVRDYADADNRLSELNGRYGMEALPFVTETYVQYDYQISSATEVLPATNPKSWEVTWQKQGHGFVIEIRNPFRKSISLDNVWIEIGTSSVKLTGPPPAGLGLDPLDELGPDEYLIIYLDTGTGSPQEAVAASQMVSTPNAAYAVTWNTGVLDAATGNTTLRLYAADATGAQLTFPYQEVTFNNPEHPDTIDQLNPDTYSSPSDPTNEWGYKHESTIGNGVRIHAALVDPATFNRAFNYDDTKEYPEDWDGSLDALGEQDKGTKGAASISTVDANTQQLIFRDEPLAGTTPEAGFWHVGELAHVAIIGPSSSETFARAWGLSGATTVEDLMLDFSSSAEILDSTSNALNVPRAVALINRFTTLSPFSDSADSDGDGSDSNTEEVVVEGRLNLNTASKSLLLRALPIVANDNLKSTIVDAIESYRIAAAGTRSGVRSEPGIASIGELMLIDDITGALTTGSLSSSYSGDTRETPAGTGVRVDFTTPDDTTGDGIADDREEEAMIMSWLSSVATVRSDVFAVYVTVRGYRDEDGDGDVFNETDDRPVEAIRFVAILDRSGIEDGDDKVKVLAVMRY